jgi:hypothetical protein
LAKKYQKEIRKTRFLGIKKDFLENMLPRWARSGFKPN